jgi:hypothetical protein
MFKADMPCSSDQRDREERPTHGRVRLQLRRAVASAVDHQSGLRAADPKYETLPGGLGHRSELEERMAPSLGKVLLGRVIHADPAPS